MQGSGCLNALFPAGEKMDRALGTGKE